MFENSRGDTDRMNKEVLKIENASVAEQTTPPRKPVMLE
jgi:hypothetical protein